MFPHKTEFREHLLPEMDVGMIKDVRMHAEVVEGLWRQDHPNIIPTIEERDSPQVEISVCQLIRIKDTHLQV